MSGWAVISDRRSYGNACIPADTILNAFHELKKILRQEFNKNSTLSIFTLHAKKSVTEACYAVIHPHPLSAGLRKGSVT